MSAIWEACRDGARPHLISGTLWRLVESQAQIATLALVDNLAEQAALEEMLETSKPGPLPPGRDYLLSTPFRYPPLPHGSRFGGRFEPSLFYGALARSSLLAEGAYYRLLFWDGMQKPPPLPLITQHTAFSAKYRSGAGLRLQELPFAGFREQLTDRCDYAATQALGRSLRAAGVEAFEYVSARDPAGALNVALYVPAALVSRRPLTVQRWICQLDGAGVEFLEPAGKTLQRFPRELFEVDGRLPAPAV